MLFRSFGNAKYLRKGDPDVRFVVQQHDARRAGKHYDYRLHGYPEDKTFSFATKKEMPKPGERPIMLFQQPLHRGAYSEFEGTLPSGYGAGEVKTHSKGSILILEATPTKIKFVLSDKRYPEEFTMVRHSGAPSNPKTTREKRTQGGSWLLFNTTPNKPPEHNKVKYKAIPADKIDKLMNPDYVMSEKIDGAMNLLDVVKDHVDVLSYRRRADTGGPIVHTHRLGLGGNKIDLPPHLRDATLIGETWGERNGKAIPVSELGGILNSSVSKSLKKQKEEGIKMRMALFGVDSFKGKKLFPEQSIEEQRKLIQEYLKYLPKDIFHEPEYAHTQADKKQMWSDISSKKNKRTSEGVVAFPTKGGVPSKVKLFPENDVYIREVFPGLGKYKGKGAGGFKYSLSPEGPVVGEVGTGFTDDDRFDMIDNPDAWIGRMARISAQEQHPSGAYRVPSFIARHEDYPQVEKQSLAYQMGKAAGTNAVPAVATSAVSTPSDSNESFLMNTFGSLPKARQDEVTGIAKRFLNTQYGLWDKARAIGQFTTDRSGLMQKARDYSDAHPELIPTISSIKPYSSDSTNYIYGALTDFSKTKLGITPNWKPKQPYTPPALPAANTSTNAALGAIPPLAMNKSSAFVKQSGPLGSTFSKELLEYGRPILRDLRAAGVRTVRTLPESALADTGKPAGKFLTSRNLPERIAANADASGIAYVPRGVLRSATLPQGVNYPVSSYLHEAGHVVGERAALSKLNLPLNSGIRDAMSQYHGRTPYHPARVYSQLASELLANNSAAQVLQKANVPPTLIQQFIASRTPSFYSHLNEISKNVREMKSKGVSESLLGAWRPYIQSLYQKALSGFTPSFSLTRDVPGFLEQFLKKGSAVRLGENREPTLFNKASEISPGLMAAAIVGGLGTPIVANMLLHRSLEKIDAETPKVNSDQISKIYSTIGIPSDMPTVKAPGYRNAGYFGKWTSRMQPEYYMADASTKKKIKKHGLIIYDPSMATAGTMAHEAGHAEIGNRPWYSPSKINQQFIRPVSGSVAGRLSILGSILGSASLSKYNRGDPLNPLYGGLIGAGAGALISLPTFISEMQATHAARKYLDASSHRNATIDKNKKALNRALMTYLIAGTAGPATMGAVLAAG